MHSPSIYTVFINFLAAGYPLRQQTSSTDKQPSMAVQPYSYQPVPAQASTANFTV